MICPKCQKYNEPGIRFCIACGTRMPMPEAAPLSDQLPPVSLDDLSRQLAAVREEIRAMRSSLELMNKRLAALERRQGSVMPAPEPLPVPAPAAVLEEAVSPEPTPVAAAPSPLPTPPQEAPRKPREWEQVLGANWLARIGVLALIIGAAFFLKLAVDNHWSGAGVAIGVAAGLTMLSSGYYWHKRYPVFSQALSGGGIAFLYLSIYAAFAIFRLVSIYPALFSLFLVSLGSAALAIKQNSMALAILGILGAFSAPFTLGYSAPSGPGVSGTDQGIQLIAYVIVVDIGVLALSSLRNWRWFTLLALLGSLIAFGGWQEQGGAGLLVSELSLTLIFLIFVGATTVFHLMWRRTSSGTDYVLMVLNAAAYFGISYGMMKADLAEWMGGFSLLLAVLYCGLAFAAHKRGAGTLTLFATGIAVVFLAIAVPVQFGDKATATIAWAAEGTVLMWLFLRLRVPQFVVYCYGAFALVALRLLFFDTSVSRYVFHPFFNERVLAFLVSIALMYLTAHLARQPAGDASEPGKKHGSADAVFLTAANLFSLWLIGAEVASYLANPYVSQGNLTIILLIVMAGVTTLLPLAWRRPIRVLDLVLLTIDAAFYFVISAFLWGSFRGWMGGFYVLCAVFYGSLSYVLFRRYKQGPMFMWVILGIALAFFTASVPAQFGGGVWTTVSWAAEMAALMWLSLMFPLPQFRIYSYAVFIIMAVRMMFFDTVANAGTFHPVLNERFLAFAAGIAATYLTGYRLWRSRKKPPQLALPASTFFVAANLFSIWLFSFEIWDYFGSRLASAGAGNTGLAVDLKNARSLSLTTLWALYAVALLAAGIARRWRLVRLWALGLLAVPILKLFVYDVFALRQLYRIVAFVGLGILLVIGGYLYQRYGGAIRGFLAKDNSARKD